MLQLGAQRTVAHHARFSLAYYDFELEIFVAESWETSHKHSCEGQREDKFERT